MLIDKDPRMATSAGPQGFHVMLQTVPSPPQRRPCEGFVGVPLARPTRIALTADPGSMSRLDDLRLALERELRALGSRQACAGPGDLGCWTTNDPRARSLLVVVATDDLPTPEMDARVAHWLDRGFEVVALAAATSDLDTVLPERLRRSNAIPW